VEVIDYMPVGVRRGDPGFRQIVRRVEAIRGSVPMRIECYPAFDYGRAAHEVRLTDDGAEFTGPGLAIELTTRVGLQVDRERGGGAWAELSLRQGEKATFVIRPTDEKHRGGRIGSEEHEQELFERTVDYWHRWIGRCTYAGRWREQVYRSALTLKLLTFEPTGALIASPTCSLPEAVGGPRNWDYRYTWIRDAAFSIYALLRIGFTEEAGAFMRWLEQRCHEREPDGGLQIMYGIHGEHASRS
jgi:GH15 family glucan-1,4-alpha-glucosidase